jgi:GDPmannose 4,6-dehydratase
LSKKIAFITGITGQDGSYLTELLLEKGYEVHGLIRRSSSFNTGRIDHIYQDPHTPNPKLILHYGDLTDGVNMTNLIHEIQPTEVYNLGAQSHVQVSFTMPQYTAQVDAVGAVALLESIRASGIKCRYYQASTSELYGSTPPPQNEDSVFRPRSPYAAAKLMAYWSTVNYREAYGVHATNGILFNHESPRRGETFVTKKITRAVARIATGSEDKLYLGNLDAVRDWGYAKEYVESMWLMLQQDKPGDYVVATGKGATVRDFAQVAFEHAGLNYQEHLEIDALIGDPSKAEKILGWKAKTDWKALAKLMVDADLEKAKSRSN